MNEIVPHFDVNKQEMKEGDVYTVHEFCRKNFSDKCLNYYRQISCAGVYECPYGFSSYVDSYGLANRIIFTSLLVQGHFNKKKIKQNKEQKNKFTYEELSRFLGILEAEKKRIKNLESLTNDETTLIRGILHEVKKLSREIDSQRSMLLSYSTPQKVGSVIENISATTQLISKRIDTYELYKNPGAITKAVQPSISIYGKFDKARYIIDSRAIKNNTPIRFSGSCYLAIEGYEVFDLLPFILLENAVKYTQPGMEIVVVFDAVSKTVEISNVGPKVKNEQIDQIFEKSIRGDYTMGFEGSGLGLFMAKQITDLHKIKYLAKSSDKIEFYIESIPYSDFKIILDFSNCPISRCASVSK